MEERHDQERAVRGREFVGLDDVPHGGREVEVRQRDSCWKNISIGF